MFLPSFCLFCFSLGNSICPVCFQKLAHRFHPFKQIFNNRCFSFYRYNSRVSFLLKKIKYRHWPWLLSEFLQNIPWSDWAIWLKWIDQISNPKLVYVPLSAKTLKTRGFNQSEMIAQYIQQLFGFSVVDCLLKINENQKQAKLKDLKSRQANVRGVYSISNPLLIRDQNLIVVDDVITTGSTINEITKILKLFGAKKVYGCSLFKGG